MRVTLIHPAGYNYVPGRSDVSILVNRMAPVGILQLAAWLEKRGHPTTVCDCLGPAAPGGLVRNTEWVLQSNPELIGFSATTSAYLDACDMAVLIKRKNPDVKIIVGGAHPSAVGAQLLQTIPEIDYLCLGEGEQVIEDLAEGKPLHEIGNLVYRDNGCVVTNARRPRLRDLDSLPFPAYEKLAGFPEAYHLPVFSFVKRYGATMITSRGCTFSCSYCDRTVFEHRYTSNSPEYIWEHMRRLRDEFGVYHINFYDDLFTASRRRVLELCELLARNPLGMDFNCAVRVGQTDPEMLRALRRAGCLQVSLGVESGNAGMLARHKPGVTPEDVRHTVQEVHSAGLRAKGLFIFGLPGETRETWKETSDFIESLRLDELNISKFSPFFGAPIWDECVNGSSGTFNEDWRLMNCLHFTFLPNGFRSRQEMDFLYNQAIQRFFRGKHFQRLFWSRLWVHRWSLWHVLSHLPAFLLAQWRFLPHKRDLSRKEEVGPLHPLQPRLHHNNNPAVTIPRSLTEVAPARNDAS